MKRFLKKDKLLVLLALLALLVSLVPIAGRMQTEENNKYYECVLDYSSLRAMARQSEMSHPCARDDCEKGDGKLRLGG